MAPKWNPQSKTMEFPKGEATSEAPDMVYLALPTELVNRISEIGVKDGAEVKAETPKGRQMKATKVARVYVIQLINDFLAARGKK